MATGAIIVHGMPFRNGILLYLKNQGGKKVKEGDTSLKKSQLKSRFNFSRGKKQHDYIGYLFITPSLLVYLTFILIPIFIGFYYSFTNFNFSGTTKFIGFQNYINLFQDQLFLKSVGNTIIYSLFTILPQMIIGLILATLLNMGLRGTVFFRTVIFLPHVTSMVAISMIWLWIYDPTLGILNRFLHFIGLDMVQWLNDPDTAMGSIIFMSIWKAIGFNMIVFLSGLQTIPTSLYEAATIDGASSWRKFLNITIPMLQPTTFFLLVTNTMSSFMVFEQVNVMTGGGPLDTTTTIVHQIYTTAFQEFRMGYAMAMAMFLFVFAAIITIANFRMGNQGNDM